MTKRRHQNRQTRKERRVDIGNKQLSKDFVKKSFDNDWKLNWFTPTYNQSEIVEAIDNHIFIVVDAPSGCGKTSCTLHKCLTDLKNNAYDKLVFIKNPTEVGDDKIGFLSGSESDKLQAHYESTKEIFHNFMSPQKLENDMNNGKILLKIPNYLLGATLDNSIIIIDECQLMSANTMKLLLERIGENSRIVVLGDSKQRYAVSKRQDGFSDFISRVTHEDDDGYLESSYYEVSYIKLTSEDNKRSHGSKFITELYDD